MNIYEMVPIVKNGIKNYVCALKCPKDYTMGEGVMQMIKELKGKNILVNPETKTVCSVYGENSCYTLAHSVNCVRNKLVFKPEGFYRHSYSTLFSVDSIYVGKQGELQAYPKKSLEDLNSKTIDFNVLKYNPFIYDISLLKRIDSFSKEGWYIGKSIKIAMANVPKEIIKIDDSFVKEINSDSSFYFKMFHAYGIYSTFLDKPFSLEISFNKKAQKINKPKQPRAEIYYEKVDDIDD